MKSIRTGYIGQADDQYVDHTRYDKDKFPEAGRKSDPKTAGGYDDVKLVNGKPEFMSKDAKPANKGGSYYLRAEDKVAFDDGRFVPGDEVASIMLLCWRRTACTPGCGGCSRTRRGSAPAAPPPGLRRRIRRGAFRRMQRRRQPRRPRRRYVAAPKPLNRRCD